MLDSCLDGISAQLADKYNLIIRPHPEYIKRFPEKWKTIKCKYGSDEVLLDENFLSNDTIYQSDILITDWSNRAGGWVRLWVLGTIRNTLLVDGEEVEAGEVMVKGDTATVTVNQDTINKQLETAADYVTIIVPARTGTAVAQLVVRTIWQSKK